jgi:DNA polymerase II large subunit
MKVRCDYCRRNLGLIVHRYWHMRFCSAACMRAYQHRLGENTKAKICRLDHAAHERSGSDA